MSTQPTIPTQRLDKTSRDNYSTAEYIRRALWVIVQGSLFQIPLPRGFAWRRFLLRRFGAKLGHRAGVHRSVRIIHPWLLTMGDWTMLGPRVQVYNLGPITIGDQTVVSQDAYLCAGTHDYTLENLPLRKPPINIGAGVWICAGAFIGPGVNVGNNSVIGARAVVMSDVAENVVAAGNPARVIKPREMRS